MHMVMVLDGEEYRTRHAYCKREYKTGKESNIKKTEKTFHHGILS